MIYALRIFDLKISDEKPVFDLVSTTPFGTISVGDVVVGDDSSSFSSMENGAEYEVVKIEHMIVELERGENPPHDSEIEQGVYVYTFRR